MRLASRFVLASASAAFTLVLGCGGGSSSDGPASEAGTDATSDGAVPDTSLPTDGTTLDSPFDVAIDTRTGCPGFVPADGADCTEAGLVCEMPDFTCGGVDTATCTGGKWHVVAPKCLSEYCQDRSPPTGTCGTPDQICRYWPDVDAASTTCAEFKCTGGTWVDTHTTTCSAPRDTCKSGTPCTSPFGCGLGHCNTYCLCGVDGVLHCTAHPC